MIMIGDMFDQGLKYRVDALCNELAGILHVQPFTDSKPESSQSQTQSSGGEFSLFVAGAGPASQWWPAELGSPASTGAQNDLRYACFPGSRQLAIQQGGQVRVYDTGEHRISGFSQQQGGDQSLTFTSQYGLVRVADLVLVDPEGDRPRNPAPPVPRRCRRKRLNPRRARRQRLHPRRHSLRWRTSSRRSSASRNSAKRIF
jgi:hypothetical protein